ncbi:alpha/beta-hydrolase [Hygrophoropsis aurantiaca]|uniref:Alpha/beta-hydrolase n=1 Tax=Hygrophoropsis aurantiaca TaxID=72124 RepID=A0ACB8ARC4_9AGAM|nr:alpha/beta-hydrolase [Hygrophoropsis aurantiaca]
MPYIDIPSKDDYVSLWYITNSVHGNVGSFDPNKPTVILLHPLFLDSSWLTRHFEDSRLSEENNLIAFDQRMNGKTRSRPSGAHDCYVEAADLAFACQTLLLPPCHILAFECVSVNAALRLTALWPELVLSLTLCDVPPPTELKWVFNAYDELLQLWCYAQDLDSFEHAGNEVVNFMTQGYDDLDLKDELIAYWERSTPPTKRLRIVELVNIMLNRTPLKSRELACITCPVLIIQGETTLTAPLKYAEKLKHHLVNAKDGARLYVVRGANACLTILPGSASIVNQVFAKFLASQPLARSDFITPPTSIFDRMKTALVKLADLVGEPEMASRDPRSSLSFSCVTPEVVKSQLATLNFYKKDIEHAYCPLGRDGRPLRKYSERQNFHWFHADRHGWSYVDSEIAAAQKKYKRRSPERGPSVNTSDLVTNEVAQDGRMRRTTFSPSSVDKLVVRGSITKVVASQGVALSKVVL